MKELKVTDIINPTYPNRSTALFGGNSSGILNWNDLRYPQLYDKRERLRATFWGVSEAGDLKNEVVQEEDKERYEELLRSTYRSHELTQTIAAVASDAAVTSVLATMIDQSNEHMIAIQDITGTREVERVHYLPIHTADELIHAIKSNVHEYMTYAAPEGNTPSLSFASDRINQDRSLHADFLLTVYTLTKKDHPSLIGDVQLDRWARTHEVFLVDDATVDAEDDSNDFILDGFDDL